MATPSLEIAPKTYGISAAVGSRCVWIVAVVVAVARALLLPFTAYFFLVFLPYFPLSVLADFAFGLGFLMLTPLLLMMVHAGMLREDFAHLRTAAGTARSAAMFFPAVLVLPALVVAGCLHDRGVLHEALDYVSAPDYSKPQRSPVDADSLWRVLAHVHAHKTGSGREFFNEHVALPEPPLPVSGPRQHDTRQ